MTLAPGERTLVPTGLRIEIIAVQPVTQDHARRRREGGLIRRDVAEHVALNQVNVQIAVVVIVK